MKYGNRSPFKKYLGSPITLVLLIMILVVLIRATSNIGHKASVGATRLSQAQAEFTKLKERNEDLSHKVNLLSSEEGLESEIRAKYRAVKEGESVAVIIDNQTAATADATSTPEVGMWHRLLQKIGL